MKEGQEPIPSVVGSFDIELFRSGRSHHATCSRFKLRCDAVALHDKEILLLSVAGSETAVKALARSLVDRLDEGDVRRLWSKVCNPVGSNEVAPPRRIIEAGSVEPSLLRRTSLFDFLETEGDGIRTRPTKTVKGCRRVPSVTKPDENRLFRE